MSHINIITLSDTFKVKNVASEMSSDKRKELAVRALTGHSTITSLAQETNTSRKFVYSQKDKALEALDAGFAKAASDEEKVQFYIPVTKSWQKQLVIALTLVCHSSYQGIIEIFRDLFNTGISKGNIHNILNEILEKIANIYHHQDLSRVRVGAHDEIFQNGSPVLVGCDSHSTYCYLLSAEKCRDSNTWGCHLLDLQQQNNLRPDYSIADGGAGLRKGQKEAWSGVPCHGDIFHALQPFLKVSSYLDNRALRVLSMAEELDKQLSKRRKLSERKNHQSLIQKWECAENEGEQAIKLADDIRTLYGWLKNDIFPLVGLPFQDRKELFNFIVSQLRLLEPSYPKKIQPLRTFLENNRDNLLEFSNLIDKELIRISQEFEVSLDQVKTIYKLQGLSPWRQKRWEQETEVRKELGNLFYPIEKAVKKMLGKTVRASSVVENLNSRLRNYFFLRKTLGKGYLDLLRFFLNHRRFIRSEHPERIGKSPRELMMGTSHDHWLELLGFKLFKKAA